MRSNKQYNLATVSAHWGYTAYGAAVKRVAEWFEDISEEQGSKSAEVVFDNYLSKSERRHHRREEMRGDLEGFFTVVDS